MTRRFRLFALLLTILVGWSATASAQSPLSNLTLEELMTLDAGQVFGASERLQPSTEAPASVSFITAEEIKRYGYRTLADILRSIRGMYVTDDRNYSLLGTRGFAKPGDYNSRILLLVNGHRVNDNIFGQAEIGAEFGMDPSTFERVEVIRGPASSLYGDSALFAVVNVITRTGASMGAPAVTVEGGTLGTGLVRGSAGRVWRGLDLAVSGTYENSRGLERIYYPEFDSPETNNGIAEDLDGEDTRQFYSRLAFKDLTFTGTYGTRRREVSTASFGSVFNSQSPKEETTDRHALIDAQYARSFNGTRLTVRGSYDRYSFDAVYPAPEPTQPQPNVLLAAGLGTRLTANVGVTRALPGRQTLRAGAEFINNLHQDQSARYTDPAFELLDSRESSKQFAVYAQDEIKVSRWFILNGGLRFDGYEEFRRVSPRAAAIVLPSPTQSFKYLFGRAFRAPNQSELNTTYYGDSVLALRPESIDTHEVIWERYTNDWLRTSASAYWYKAEELITAVAEPTALTGVSFINQGEVRAKGVEFEAQVRLRGESRALVSYALQRAAEAETGAELANSPRHVTKGRISLAGPTRGSFISAEGQYLSGRKTIVGTEVDAAFVLHVTFTQPLGRRAELVATVRNLFDNEYRDPASSSHWQEAIPQNGRTARIGLRWTFGAN
jgi:outer membrane receptor for ferrienterochelin and colicins